MCNSSLGYATTIESLLHVFLSWLALWLCWLGKGKTLFGALHNKSLLKHWKNACAVHLSCVFLTLLWIQGSFVMLLLSVVVLFWNKSTMVSGIQWNFLANVSPVLSAITQLLIENLLLLNCHWKSGGSFWLAKDFYFWLIMLPSLICILLPPCLGGMPGGLIFCLNLILRYNTSKAATMWLLMCYHVFLVQRTCPLHTFVLWHIPLASPMLRMFLWLFRAVPWLHLLLQFLRIRLS